MERVIGGVEHRVLNLYGRSLWFFLRHRWISALTWVVCLVGTGIPVLHVVPKAFLPVGDSSFHPRRVDGPGRLLARADARVPGAGGGRTPRQSRRGDDLHGERERQFSSREPGVPAGVPERSVDSGRPFKPWPAN